MKRIMLVVLLAVFVLSSCGKSRIESPTESMKNSSGKSVTESAAQREPYVSNGWLFRIGEKTKTVLDDGTVADVLMPSDVEIGTGIYAMDMQIDVDKNNTAVAKFSGYPYQITGNVYLLKSDQTGEALCKEMAGLIFRCKFNSIAAFTIQKAEILSQTGGVLHAEITVDLLPTAETRAFQEYNPLIAFGTQTWIRNKQYHLKISGTDGIYSGELDDFIFFGEQKEAACDEFLPSEAQRILLVTPELVLYQQREYLADSKEKEYETSMIACNRLSGEKTVVGKAKRNADYDFYSQIGDKVFFTSRVWAPYSESFVGDCFIFDVGTAKMEQKDWGFILFKEGQSIFAVKDGALLEIDASTNTSRTVCTVPFGSEDPYSLYEWQDGKLQLLLFNDGTKAYDRLEIDISTGETQTLALFP